MKKLNTKILIIVLLALLTLFALSRFFRAPSLEGNLRKELVSIDTAAIDEVKILSYTQDGELKLSRQGSNWRISKGALQSETDRGLVNSLLGSIKSLKPVRLASRKKEKWEEFNVADKGIHVTAFNDSKKKADFVVGKSGFSQRGSYTYVRVSDENEIYVVEGSQEESFNRSYNDWRNKTILRIRRDDITKIVYRYPSDSGFVVDKRDSVWYAANTIADKNKIEALLNQLTFKNLNDFSEGFSSVDQPTATIQIDSKAGNLVTIKSWKISDQQWVVNSTLQKDVYFLTQFSSISADLLIGKNKLLPSPK